MVELCRYLIARAGGVVSRDELIELLWPGADPAQSAHRLHVAISKLRILLGGLPAVQFDGQHYSIPADELTTDCALFDQQYSSAMAHFARGQYLQAATVLQSALALYRGDYLEDALYADWTAAPRLHYTERRLTALTYLCEYSSLESDLGGVLDYATQLVEVDNLRERAHRELMVAHYRLGQRALAIRQYLRCSHALERELGTRPSRETLRLYEAIRDDTPLPLERALLRSP